MKKTAEGSGQTYGDPSVRATGQRATYGFGLGLARGIFLPGICFVLLIGCGAAWGQEPAPGKKDYQYGGSHSTSFPTFSQVYNRITKYDN
jgi:hypothetical protein